MYLVGDHVGPGVDHERVLLDHEGVLPDHDHVLLDHDDVLLDHDHVLPDHDHGVPDLPEAVGGSRQEDPDPDANALDLAGKGADHAREGPDPEVVVPEHVGEVAAVVTWPGQGASGDPSPAPPSSVSPGQGPKMPGRAGSCATKRTPPSAA